MTHKLAPPVWLRWLLAAVFIVSVACGWQLAEVAADDPDLAQGTVSVYKGVERPGLERRACLFKDGIFVQRGEISAQRIIVTNPVNVEFYRSEPIPELQGYAIQSIQCGRSSQTGLLVLVIGGFYAGSASQQSLTISTPYFIQQEVVYTGGPP